MSDLNLKLHVIRTESLDFLIFCFIKKAYIAVFDFPHLLLCINERMMGIYHVKHMTIGIFHHKILFQ